MIGHAQIVAQLLDGRSKRVVGPVELLLLGAVLAGMVVGFLRIPTVIHLVLALLVPIGLILGVFYLRQATGYSVNAVIPALACGGSLFVTALLRTRYREFRSAKATTNFKSAN